SQPVTCRCVTPVLSRAWRQERTGTWSRVGVAGPTITTYTDTTVSANTTYAYLVRATNNIGASDWSNTVSVTTTTPPTAPSNLAAAEVRRRRYAHTRSWP